MVIVERRQAAAGHVGISNGLYLFNTHPLGTLVKAAEQVVQGRDNLSSGMVAGNRRKAHNVGEEHGDVIKVFTDCMHVVLEFFGNLVRQDCAEQLVGLFLLMGEFPGPFGNQAFQPDVLQPHPPLLQVDDRKYDDQRDDCHGNPEPGRLPDVRLLNKEHRLRHFGHIAVAVYRVHRKDVPAGPEVCVRDGTAGIRRRKAVVKAGQLMHEQDTLGCVKAEARVLDVHALGPRLELNHVGKILVFHRVDPDAFYGNERQYLALADPDRVVDRHAVHQGEPEAAVPVAQADCR